MGGRVRKRIIFFGQVQGVGFRYRAFYIASSLGLTGFAKNLYDGSVHLEAQGDEKAIEDMVAMLRNSEYIHIEDMEVEELPLLDESSFRIG